MQTEVEEYPIQKVPIDKLQFDSSNPNKPTKEQISAIKKSFHRFGYLVPIVVNESYQIGDGEHRALIYKELGIKEIPAYIVPRINDDIERRLLRQTMNKLRGEHEIKLDADEIALIFQSDKLDNLAELIATERESLENILTKHKGIQFQHEDGFDVDKALEDLVPETKLGDIWQLGQHRIICADCTDKRSLDRLLEDKKPEIILTDPPYSSGGFQEAGKKTGSIGNRQGIELRSDNLSTRGYINMMNEWLSHINTDVIYIFTDWRMWSWNFDIVEKNGYVVRNMIVWDKEQMGMGMPWRNQHELILYGKKTSAKVWDGQKGNVLRVPRATNKEHPTAKPIELIYKILENNDEGAVFDPFLGSGSTLIACEQTNRICYGVEIDPHYCDVVVKRWEAFTGKKAEKVIRIDS